MNESWSTGWDPYEELMLHRNNIQQCAQAINTGSELMRELGAKYNHQQEVINQLMFQNRKLQQQLEQLRLQLTRQDTELAVIKTKLPQ